MSDIAAFILARLEDDEMAAREASRHHDEPLVEGGEHWRWECSEHDEVVEPDPLTQEFLECPSDDSIHFSLRSVEQYPYRSMPGEGPSIHISTEETSTAAAGHIARHDPARVLAEVAAKQTIVELHTVVIHPVMGWGDDDPLTERNLPTCRTCGTHSEYPVEWPCQTVRLLAQPYADDESFQEEWRVG